MKIDAKWNDLMYSKHPTPYYGLAGIVEKIRIFYVLSKAKIGRGERVLEIGCEAGNLLLSMPQPTKLTGFDISRLAILQAKRNFKAKKRKATFVQGDAMKKLPFKKGEFDVVICSETLEHVENPAVVLNNIAAICNDNTKVIITVPNENPKIQVKNFLERLKLLNLIMPGIENAQSEWHLHAFSVEMLRKILSEKFSILSMNNILGLHIIAKAKLRSV